MNRLTKEDLKEILKESTFRGFLNPGLAVNSIDVVEMGTYTGVVMKNPAASEHQVMPVFNLDAACRSLSESDVTDKTEAARFLAQMMNEFVKRVPGGNFDISGIEQILSDYDAAKNRIYMEGVSYNYDRPDALVHENLGMKFVPKILLEESGHERKVTAVTHSLAEKWGVSEETVINDAIKNTSHILKPSVNFMADVLKNGGIPSESYEGAYKMGVVTGASKTGAASLILDNSVLDRVSEMYHGSNFFILPSSVHEFLTIPVDSFAQENADTINSFAEMVAEVNDTMDDEDIASFDVYHYAADTHRLEKAADYCINKQFDDISAARNEELKEMNEKGKDEPENGIKM